MDNINEEAVDEVIEETEEETPEETTEETPETEVTVDWEAKAKELEGRNKRLQTKLDKTSKSKPTEKTTTNELDFGQLAFHNSKTDVIKIESEEDMDFLKDTMAETGKSQDALLKSKWFMAELEEKRSATEKATANKRATPTSKRSVAVDSENIDYWMKQPFEKVPKKLRGKVLAKQVATENSPFEFE